MKRLQQLLEQSGYESQQDGNQLILSLDGIANTVYVFHDVRNQKLNIRTNEKRLAALYAFLLFVGLAGMDTTSTLFCAGVVTVAVYGLISVVLTELKLRPLREKLPQYNATIETISKSDSLEERTA